MSDIPIDCLDQQSTLLLCFITERIINSNNSCRPCLMSVVLYQQLYSIVHHLSNKKAYNLLPNICFSVHLNSAH